MATLYAINCWRISSKLNCHLDLDRIYKTVIGSEISSMNQMGFQIVCYLLESYVGHNVGQYNRISERQLHK